MQYLVRYSTRLKGMKRLSTSPNVESIVKNVVTQKFGQTFVTVPATLRLFFHDCFVEVRDICI